MLCRRPDKPCPIGQNEQQPMGWSERGADRISKLRAYKGNGGKVIDLKVSKVIVSIHMYIKDYESLILLCLRAYFEYNNLNPGCGPF